MNNHFINPSPNIEYTADITTDNIETLTHFDLTDFPYHGGTTFSSGVLPKWDLLDNTYMIKRCSIDDFGNCLTDAFNEELVYLFCKTMGIDAAYYRIVFVKYKDEESGKTIEAPAALTRIFDGLVHYRDIRQLCGFGKTQDELHDLTERFDAMPVLNDMFFIDYIFNQQDRHSKNIGMVNNTLAPIFDSGACLFYDVFDSELSPSYYDITARHKTFGRSLGEQLQFSLTHVCPHFSFDFDCERLKQKFIDTFNQVAYHYSAERVSFIKAFVTRRIDSVGQILAKAQNDGSTSG
jgi:hypothetical protein